MNRKETIQEKFNELRRQAEALMMKKGVVTPSTVDRDPLELIHELQTFQVELELQNEELQRSQQELMEFKVRYTELYDFTPVGYVCLDIKGVIRNANLTLADMLSLERSSLINQPLSGYVFFEDQDIYYRHLKDLAESKKRQICELRMRKSDGTILDVQLESIVFSYQSWRPEQYRSVIIDIAERKQMEKEREALRIQLHQSHKMESIRTIAVQNRVEGGTLVTMLFPIVDQKKEKKIKPINGSSHGTERILFVDDEEKARQLGIAAYMMKPVSMLKIAKTIRKLMDQ